MTYIAMLFGLILFLGVAIWFLQAENADLKRKVSSIQSREQAAVNKANSIEVAAESLKRELHSALETLYRVASYSKELNAWDINTESFRGLIPDTLLDQLGKKQAKTQEKPVVIVESKVGHNCPLCRDTVKKGVGCGACNVRLHRACVDEFDVDRCPSIGCSNKLKKVRV